MTPLRRLLLGIAACAAVAAPALASDPSSGTVSNAAPSVTWKGTAPGYGVVPTNILVTTAGEDPQCPPQTCDTFKLTVADQADLTVSAACKTDGQFTELHVKKPDGTTLYVQSAAGKPASIKVKNAAKGDYTIEVITNDDVSSGGDYTATATLGSTKPAASPTPGASATPGATPPPSNSGSGSQPAATLSLKTKSASAKKARKKLSLGVGSSKPVTNVQEALIKGKKVVANAKLASLGASGKLAFKLRKALKAGAYTVAITAKDGTQTVGVRAPLKIKK
jgi:nitrogen fixation protein FixH